MKIRDIIGVPVIAMKEGSRQGCVVDAVIDAGNMTVSHYLVGRDSKYDLLIVDAADVSGVGGDYMVVADAGNIRRVFGDPKRMETVSRGFYLGNAEALSSTGRLLGRIADFVLNEDSGQIVSLLLEDGQELPAERVLAMSGATVFVEEDNGRVPAAKAAENLPPKKQGGTRAENKHNTPPVPVQAHRAYQESSPPAASRDRSAQSASGGSGPSARINFRKMLIGKKMARDVVSDDGVFKANEGDTITEWMVQLAEQHDALPLLMKHVEPS